MAPARGNEVHEAATVALYDALSSVDLVQVRSRELECNLPHAIDLYHTLSSLDLMQTALNGRILRSMPPTPSDPLAIPFPSVQAALNGRVLRSMMGVLAVQLHSNMLQVLQMSMVMGMGMPFDRSQLIGLMGDQLIRFVSLSLSCFR